MQRSKDTEMCYFYSRDQVEQESFNMKWHPGQENLGDYQNKNHMGKHHVHLRPVRVTLYHR